MSEPAPAATSPTSSPTTTTTIPATPSATLPALKTPRPTGPRISLSSITPNNIGTLRKLNSVIFPVSYSDKFYKDVLLPEAEEFCKLVYYNDIPVGTACCRIEKGVGDEPSKLYIMTMGVLAPYRSRTLGSHSLEHIISAASTSTLKPPLSKIYLHVQVSNDSAKRFYEQHGFKEVGRVEGYYKKILPRDAWVLERLVEHVEAKPEGAGAGQTKGKGK